MFKVNNKDTRTTSGKCLLDSTLGSQINSGPNNRGGSGGGGVEHWVKSNKSRGVEISEAGVKISIN